MSEEAQPATDFRDELIRVKKVADMLCTGHAILKDRYQRRALFLDLSILVLSTWLVALTFVDPKIGSQLTPFHVDPQIWIGVIAVLTFGLSIVQIKVDWKGISDAHSRSFDMYAETKRQSVYILRSNVHVDRRDCEGLLSLYDVAGKVGTAIPERQFLRLKKQHSLKIAISKHLDSHPGASIPMIRLRIWWKDTWGRSAIS